jgi:Na+-driven multidrug efflux pump
MDYSQPGFWIAIGIGGTLVGTLSAAQQYSSKEEFRMRAVLRDFCIGAFLTAIIYMFIPDTIQSLLSSVSETTSNLATKVSAVTEDIELQVGPARF